MAKPHTENGPIAMPEGGPCAAFRRLPLPAASFTPLSAVLIVLEILPPIAGFCFARIVCIQESETQCEFDLFVFQLYPSALLSTP